MNRTHWAVTGLAVLAAVLGTLLAVEYLRASGPKVAFAQGTEGAVGANSVLAMLGNTVNDATPLVVIDTKTETILMYEYIVSRRALFLRAARTYRSDRELRDSNFFKGDVYNGPNVDDIQKMLGGRR